MKKAQILLNAILLPAQARVLTHAQFGTEPTGQGWANAQKGLIRSKKSSGPGEPARKSNLNP